ncbi:4'-phosphopantetheinyl transferase family protein [Streptomyces sp. NPDC059761]|uniref:4'-phosphopantetheinyl transferase family protein n=1 Tax=Streptomyces sp. NPDC059761 TaxID=3346937 RepID=UPI003649784A
MTTILPIVQPSLLVGVPSAHRPPPPPGGEPQLWEVPPRAFAPAARALADEVLDPAERERAARIRHPEDRDVYVAAHVALRMLLGVQLGVDAGEVVLGRRPCPGCGDPHGRPYVSGDAVHFSLSYTRGRALLAFAAVPVGVDIEPAPAPATVVHVSSALHPRERAELAVLPKAERAAAFCRIWVRKEAYFKGLGIGLARGLQRDWLGADPAGSLQPDGWRIHDVEVGDGLSAAVAVAADTTASDGGR